MTNKYSTTLFIESTPQKIFSFYQNVSSWKSWDSELEYSKLDQKFENNSKGVLKPKGNAELQFVLQNVNLNQGFDQIMNLPFGSKFVLTRRVRQLNNGSEVTHSGYFEGFFGSIIGFFLKLKYTPLLAKSAQDLKNLCESSN